MSQYLALPQSRLEKVRPNGPILQLWPKPGAACAFFYPGSLLEPRHYILFINSLYKRGFAVAAPHLSGHGLAKKQGGFTFESLLAEGLRAEAWLLRNGLGPVAVCGHSQGGILAMAHAAASSNAGAAFSICSAFPRMEQAIGLTIFKNLARHRQKLLTAIKRLARVFPGLPVPLPFYLSIPKLLKGRRKPIIMGAGKGRASYPLKYLASLFDADIPAGLHCPWVLFSALDDALFTPELSQAVYERAIAPAKELVWLPCGGHMAILNPHISDFVAARMAENCASNGMTVNLT